MANNKTAFDAIRESFELTPTPFNEEMQQLSMQPVTTVMQNDSRYSDLLEKSKKVMELVEERYDKKNRNKGVVNTPSYGGSRQSLLDDIQQFNGGYESYQQPKQQINNTQMFEAQKQYSYTQPQYTAIQQPQSNNFDYSLLKMIVNECIKENLQQIKESLNENTIRGMRINPGGVIQVLDKNGTLYEGVLKVKQRK